MRASDSRIAIYSCDQQAARVERANKTAADRPQGRSDTRLQHLRRILPPPRNWQPRRNREAGERDTCKSTLGLQRRGPEEGDAAECATKGSAGTGSSPSLAARTSVRGDRGTDQGTHLPKTAVGLREKYSDDAYCDATWPLSVGGGSVTPPQQRRLARGNKPGTAAKRDGTHALGSTHVDRRRGG